MIKTNVIEAGSIVEFVMEDVCVLEEVLEIISNEYPNYSTGIIWNFVSGSLLTLDSNGMRQIAAFVKRYAVHKRTAYVGKEDLEFGLLRMYEAYADMEEVSPIMKLFRDRESALKWINCN
jgi:hypothetical protein